ncbi:hypothetical protein [Burkholderia guangdongensis]|uniref:hypothetical protein n=1 Tax=Burkholderia guangdongensis TaxID=1792500 RepID=UPI0015CE6307|nr:hypothetical protein [Burkholderia guangdongensis]
MSNKFFASGSNATFDLSGVKKPAEQLDLSADAGVKETTFGNKFDDKPWSKTEFIVDNDVTGENITVAHTVDLGDSVQYAQDWSKNLDSISSYGEEMRPLMNIPGIVIEQYCIRRGVSWREFWSAESNGVHLRAILTDPDLSYFRLRSYNSKTKK